MLRKLILIILILLAIAGSIGVFYYYNTLSKPVSKAINAVPQNAAIIVSSNHFRGIHRKLTQTNIMWEELQVTDYLKEVNKNASYLDSLIEKNQKLSEFLKNKPIITSVHVSGARTFDFLFSINLPANVSNDEINELLIESSGETPSIRTYDGVNIQEFTLSGNEKLSYAKVQGVVMLSFNPILVEDAIRQIKKGKPVTNNKAFKAVLKTAGNFSDANVFINFNYFEKILGTFLKPPVKEQFTGFGNLAEWAEMDTKIKPNAIMFNGFSFASDSGKAFLNLFRDQSPQDFEMKKVIPSDIAHLLHFGLSNFKNFHSRYKDYLSAENKFFEYEKYLDSFTNKYNADLEELFLSCIGNEIAAGISEPATPEFKNQTFTAFRVSGIEKATNNLAVLSALTDSEDKEKYRSYTIRKIGLDNLFSTFFGTSFKNVDQPYYSIIGKYAVFCSEKSFLRNIINDVEYGNTLQKNINFNAFAENLSSDANVFFLSNIARSVNVYKDLAREKYATQIDNRTELFRKFESMAFQISYSKDNLFYTNGYLKYNPSYKQETNTLWEIALDTTFSGKPHLVKNHYTKTGEIFLQDDGNTIYLISTTGKILWKKKLKEPIISDIYQIDFYKNNKLQLLFNTSSRLYLLDRKGRMVENYPIELKSPATNGLVVLDYDHDKDYRILIGGKDKHIYNYDKSGEIVKGWEFEKTKNVVKLPVQYFNLKKKDYIIISDSGGNVKIVNRKGQDRIKLKEKLPTSRNQNVVLAPASEIEKCKLVTTDSIGNIAMLYFNDKLEKWSIEEWSKNHFFDFKDLNRDKKREFIFLDKNYLNVFKQDKNLLFDFAFNNSSPLKPLYFNFPGNKGKVGVTDPDLAEIYLFNNAGVMEPGFPLFGTTLFSIGDINKDETYNLIVGGDSGKLFCYNLE